MSLHVTQSWPENGGSFKNPCRWFCIWQQKMGTRPCVLWIVLSVMDLVSHIYRDILLFSLVVGEGGGYLLNDIPPRQLYGGCTPDYATPYPQNLQEQAHRSSIVTFIGVFSTFGYLMAPHHFSTVPYPRR